jgi:hypothetical protein
MTILSYKHAWIAAQLECGRSWLKLPFDVCWFYFTFGTTMNFKPYFFGQVFNHIYYAGLSIITVV